MSFESKVEQTLVERILFLAQDGEVRLDIGYAWKDVGNSTAELNEIWEPGAPSKCFASANDVVLCRIQFGVRRACGSNLSCKCSRKDHLVVQRLVIR